MKIKYGIWASCPADESPEIIEQTTTMVLGRIRRLKNGVYTYKPTIRVGRMNDDFIQNNVTIVATYFVVKVPRILDRIYGKKTWQK